jgi:hypothetical protein
VKRRTPPQGREKKRKKTVIQKGQRKSNLKRKGEEQQ